MVVSGRGLPAPPPGLTVNVHQLHGQPQRRVGVPPAQGDRGRDIMGGKSLLTTGDNKLLTGVVCSLGNEGIVQMARGHLRGERRSIINDGGAAGEEGQRITVVV